MPGAHDWLCIRVILRGLGRRLNAAWWCLHDGHSALPSKAVLDLETILGSCFAGCLFQFQSNCRP